MKAMELGIVSLSDLAADPERAGRGSERTVPLMEGSVAGEQAGGEAPVAPERTAAAGVD